MFDEMTGSADAGGAVRPPYAELSRWLETVKPDLLNLRRREAEVVFRRIGITFAVYGDPEAQERLIPFDIIPRILGAMNGSFCIAGSSRGPRRSTPMSKTSMADATLLKPA